ncbi:FAD-binding and (Fe-S)-binding domain-containing protein [Achromobacter seleniivolatilans]|uniref:FAD-binding and (Fe-S)-binding domain-containing protein n=1 Tax=Achromobacter seleniivolatilans TaxID=3047478 RepID=A0ABY9M542_9BURK|nr:FAD-binding and (Fe-S)-binding domain-containing protein [Achromobacter sp. R39]WMD22133.1 FAD-binding and (Fe-S)-binding domain-containing protein [Achromobacter sp. R39]
MSLSNFAPKIEVNALLSLRAELAADTTCELRFDAATRAAYASEASNYRQPPLGVVIPKTIEDMEKVVSACGRLGIAMVPRGAGTSMCGQSVNAAVCIDHSKYLNDVTDVWPERGIARVQPGVICDQLKTAAAAHGLTFGPDPATHSRCTIGGMVGNNSCGAHSVMAGKTVENIERLEIVTATGARFWVGPTDDAAYEAHLARGGEQARIVQALRDLTQKYADDIRQGFPRLKRRVSGFNLDQLLPENGFNIARALVGSEGTCATTLHAETTLVAGKAKRVLLVLGFDSIFDAADSVPMLLPMGAIAMEGVDNGIVGGLKKLGLKLDDIAELPSGNAWLLVEFGADSMSDARQMAVRAQQVATQLASCPSARLVDEASLMSRLWTIRETGASATSLSDVADRPDPTVGWEDAAVEPEHLGKYLREFTALVESYGYKTNLYGHFGDGCIHSRITFDLRSTVGVADWRRFLKEASELVVKYGGSLSGEHGDGQAKGEFLPLMFSPRLMDAFREFKRIWDPKGLMNPGKLIDAWPVDSNLRMGPEYQRASTKGIFSYANGATHDTEYARETERCIGMGKCRSTEGGTMCPSFKATREELYSTRGRARLFFELLNGKIINEVDDQESVKDSMDLCLSCKGCKVDCPTHVDIPKYRSEFLYRYYKRKLRSPVDIAVGRIGQWLPVASRVAPLANALLANSVLRRIGGALGLAPQAKLPTINKSFRKGKVAKSLGNIPENAAECQEVIIWTDTFNSGFTPHILEAAITVVRAAGWLPRLTKRHVCCGRPFYDVGLLDQAKANLLEILDLLEDAIAQGTPVLVLEPSCLSVFRDEMPSLLRNDPRAKTLAGLTVTIAEFAKRAGIRLPEDEAVHLHAHCHQRACGGMSSERELGAKVLDTGCCGMAGAFGYHAKTAPVSERIGNTELVPKLNALPTDAVLVADGFSCRNQIGKLSDRNPKHLAEVLAESVTAQVGGHQ